MEPPPWCPASSSLSLLLSSVEFPNWKNDEDDTMTNFLEQAILDNIGLEEEEDEDDDYDDEDEDGEDDDDDDEWLSRQELQVTHS